LTEKLPFRQSPGFPQFQPRFVAFGVYRSAPAPAGKVAWSGLPDLQSRSGGI